MCYLSSISQIAQVKDNTFSNSWARAFIQISFTTFWLLFRGNLIFWLRFCFSFYQMKNYFSNQRHWKILPLSWRFYCLWSPVKTFFVHIWCFDVNDNLFIYLWLVHLVNKHNETMYNEIIPTEIINNFPWYIPRHNIIRASCEFPFMVYVV